MAAAVPGSVQPRGHKYQHGMFSEEPELDNEQYYEKYKQVYEECKKEFKVPSEDAIKRYEPHMTYMIRHQFYLGMLALEKAGKMNSSDESIERMHHLGVIGHEPVTAAALRNPVSPDEAQYHGTWHSLSAGDSVRVMSSEDVPQPTGNNRKVDYMKLDKFGTPGTVPLKAVYIEETKYNAVEARTRARDNSSLTWWTGMLEFPPTPEPEAPVEKKKGMKKKKKKGKAMKKAMKKIVKVPKKLAPMKGMKKVVVVPKKFAPMKGMKTGMKKAMKKAGKKGKK